MLGLICILFLPGYNLLNLIKPKFNLIQKLGYTTILSIAMENIIMFFNYISFLYFSIKSSENPRFFFNIIFIIIIVQVINIILILINFLKSKKNSNGDNKDNNIQPYSTEEKIKKSLLIVKYAKINLKIKKKVILIYFCFIISLIFLSISAYINKISNNKFSVIQKEYRQNFTFFYRVPIIFYLFLIISVFCLVFIIFYTHNEYLILLSISAFLYCLWILPYLQIGNYFGQDSYFLKNAFTNYQKYGISSEGKYHFVINKYDLRYSSSIFTAIILVGATGVDIDFALWYLYPLIFIFCPFYFYSIFKKFSKNKENINLTLILLTVLALLNAQFLKCAHSATTMVLSLYVFYILVIEFLDFLNERDIFIKVKNFFFIIFLYFFLCLTHFEECIYFLIIIVLYSNYYFFFKIKNSKFYNESFNPNYEGKYDVNHYKKLNSKKGRNTKINIYNNNEKFIKKSFFIIEILLIILLVIFYITQIFFGYLSNYYYAIIHKDFFLNKFYNINYNFKFILKMVFNPEINSTIISVLFIILVCLSYIFICYCSIFRFNRFFLKFLRITLIFITKIHLMIKKLISLKLIQALILIISIISIILINLFYLRFLEKEGIFLLIEILLNYTIIIINIFFFIKGFLYYMSKDHKQNYFLISILASSSIMILFFLSNINFLAFHILNSRFIPMLIFFNLIIIQNNYFESLMRKKRLYLISLFILLLFLGIFYSLNKIGWE